MTQLIVIPNQGGVRHSDPKLASQGKSKSEEGGVEFREEEDHMKNRK